MYALCWSQIPGVNIWKSYGLDYALLEGGKLYKSLNKISLLLAELPCTTIFFNSGINMRFLELQTDQISLAGDQFLGSSIPVHCQYGFLLFIGGFTTAVMSFTENLFLFDTHSPDYRGLSIQGGTSVLLKFQNLTEIVKDIHVVYQEYRGFLQTYFQIPFVKPKINLALKSHFN